MNKIVKHKLIFFYLIVLIFFSCGITTPTEVNKNLNPPQIFKVIPGDKSFTIIVNSYNNNFDFSGYNVYFNFDSTSQLIDQYRILINNTYPAIQVSPNNKLQQKSLFLNEKIIYTKKSSGYNINFQDYFFIENGTTYYIALKAYSFVDNIESDRSKILSVTPRYEFLNKTKTFGNILTYNDLEIKFNLDNTIVGKNKTSLQDLGYYENMNDVYYAKTKGYTSDNFKIKKNHLYLFVTINTNFGKLYINQIDNSIINFNFTYQSKQGNTNI